MVRQIKAPIDVEFEIYRSNLEISAWGYVERDEFLYMICGDYAQGTNVSEDRAHGEREFVKSIFWEAERIRERFPNADITISFPDNGHPLPSYSDGYFGRRQILSSTTVLKPIGKRSQARLKSLISKLNNQTIKVAA